MAQAISLAVRPINIFLTQERFRCPSTAIDPPPPLSTKNSIGSRLAATFSGPRTATALATYAPPTEPSFVSPSPVLAPSASRAASYESGSSNASRPRSTTPRPAQPLTISLSSDDLSEFKDLFIRPPQDSRADLDVRPSPPLSPIHPRRGQTPASAIAAVHRQATSTGDVQSPSRSSRYSRTRKRSDSDKEPHGPSGIPESPRLVTQDGEKGLPPSPLPAPGSILSPENGNSTIRSRVRPRSRNKSSEIPPPQPGLSLSRPTIKATLSPPSTDIAEAFDIETASAPQLREALKTRNQQYDELASYVLKVAGAEGLKEVRISSLKKEFDQGHVWRVSSQLPK
jgi:hypothetical protein